MIKSMAVYLTNILIRNHTIEEDQRDVYLYGFELLVSSAINFFLIIILGILFNRFTVTIFFIIQYYSIKKVSGGYHANTHQRCIISFTTIYALILFYQTQYEIKLNAALIIGWAVGFFLIMVFAPVEDLQKPLEQEEKIILKKKSIFLYIFYSVINAIIICFLNGIFFTYAWYGIIALNLIAVMMLAGMLKNDYERRRIKDDKNSRN